MPSLLQSVSKMWGPLDAFSLCLVNSKPSFKYGIFEGERHGRYFLDLNEESIKKHLKGTNLSIIDMLVTEDVRKDKETKWLNIIFKKVKI